MPSKFVSKTFVREEAFRAAEKSRREISLRFKSLQKALVVQPRVGDRSSVKDIWEAIYAVQGRVESIDKEVKSYNKKLSVLVEGLVRGVVKDEKGPKWIEDVNVESGDDILRYIAQRKNQKDEKE